MKFKNRRHIVAVFFFRFIFSQAMCPPQEFIMQADERHSPSYKSGIIQFILVCFFIGISKSLINESRMTRSKYKPLKRRLVGERKTAAYCCGFFYRFIFSQAMCPPQGFIRRQDERHSPSYKSGIIQFILVCFFIGISKSLIDESRMTCSKYKPLKRRLVGERRA